MKLFLSILLLSCTFICRADRFLNLGFELMAYSSTAPMSWDVGGKGYTVGLDSIIKYKGRYSLRMEGAGKTENDYASCGGVFPLAIVAGKKVRLKGHIKTENITAGNAALWCMVYGKKGRLAYNDMSKDSLNGTHDWKEFTIDVAVSEEAAFVSFGCAMTGKGKAWFDDLQVYINDTLLDDNANMPNEPLDDELKWLRSAIIPLKTTDMNSSDDDLTPLKQLTEGATIVALGEQTHGASAIYRMKSRIIKYLVEKEGFDLFAMESNMPEAYRLNDYITDGKGDPKELIKGMYYWAWDTQEMLDLVEWLKKYNGAHARKVLFAGFDMQYYEVAIAEVRKICSRHDDKAILSSIAKLKEHFDSLQHHKKLTAEEKDFDNKEWGALNEFANKYITDKKEHDWLVQNTRILRQNYDDTDLYTRDRFMAENLLWIKAQNPHAKIIAWAHNMHIQKTDSSMGSYVYKALEEKYATIGFAFHDGTYTAWEKGGLASHRAQASYPGTFEYYFHKTGVPVFLIDFRNVPAGQRGSKWLTSDLETRNIGKTARPMEFLPRTIIRDFDMMVFIDHTANSTVVHEHSKNE